MPAAAPSPRDIRYVGRRRTVAERSGGRPRRTVLRSVGAVASLGLVAGAVAIGQALPQRAEAASPASVGARVLVEPDLLDALAANLDTGPERMRPAVPRPVGEPRTAPVSRSTQRTPLSWCDGKPPTRHYANGRIPLRSLCRLPFAHQHRLRADAAVALARLDTAYEAAFGHDLCLTDSYRSYASQVSVAARKPGLAARPGTSEHGWGLAVDLCDGAAVPGAREHTWLLAHAPASGWDNPAWARPHGSRPEPWHWEYVSGE